jgi:hypothetical protein
VYVVTLDIALYLTSLVVIWTQSCCVSPFPNGWLLIDITSLTVQAQVQYLSSVSSSEFQSARPGDYFFHQLVIERRIGRPGHRRWYKETGICG